MATAFATVAAGLCAPDPRAHNAPQETAMTTPAPNIRANKRFAQFCPAPWAMA